MVQIRTGATKQMREALMSRGHFEGENMRLLAKFFVLLTVIFILNTILDIFFREAHQFEEKIFRFKNINMLLCGLAFAMVDADTYRLISFADDQESFDSTFKPSKERISLQEKLNAELDLNNKLLYFVTLFTMGTFSIAPFIATIFLIYPKILSGSLDEIKVTSLSLPITFWYPEEYANLYIYFSLSILQIFYLYLFSGHMYCVLTSGSLALKITIYDMKLLCLTVKEWEDQKLEQSRCLQDEKCLLKGMLLLKNKIVNVIKSHHMVCRKANHLNKCLETMYTVFNNTICFQICVLLYSSTKMDDFVLKIEHLLLVLPMTLILFLYCSYAQVLLNEGENFRSALWESNFVDKPLWYKSSLLIIMIRNMKEFEIKPFGFYVLNLRTFSMVMNAAYSYFNMLNSLKTRI